MSESYPERVVAIKVIVIDVDDELARGHEQVIFLAVGEDTGGRDLGNFRD